MWRSFPNGTTSNLSLSRQTIEIIELIIHNFISKKKILNCS